jgi:tRNA-2-methylthio-N6-dimethylallyladenosine synthase
MKSVYIETYGCQMNVADSETVGGLLARHGYALAATPDEADVILLNTCAVREHAEERVLGRLGEMARYKQLRPGVVLGVLDAWPST